MKSKLIIGIFLLFIYSFACLQEEKQSLTDSRTMPTKGTANPAAAKCIEDGHTIKIIEENGVSIGYWCVNKKTSKKCEIWSYFRGECDLSP
ncbi:hypothetical protein [Desulfobacter curvatus]|uniref:hypothetical protein n=1 Tax=Desulfobacter curvatus TaxID=2290 RepID=UPI000374F811|nr:hypothetical protein [Desulfobacter curvatus]